MKKSEFKTTFRRTGKSCLALVLAVIITVFFSFTGTASAATAKTAYSYDAEAALAYASANWDSGEGDCVAFVRACIEAGGIPREPKADYNYGYTVKKYMDYLINHNFAELHELTITNHTFVTGKTVQYIAVEENKDILQPGDVIMYECQNPDCPKPQYHVALCAPADPDDGQYAPSYRYYAHNGAVGNKPLCTINCSKCKADKTTIKMYSLHIKSEANGFAKPPKSVSKVAVAKSSSKVKVSWAKGEGIDGYQISKSTSKSDIKISGTYSIDKLSKNSEKYYKLLKATKGKNYYYRVRAYKTLEDGTKVYGPCTANKLFKL